MRITRRQVEDFVHFGEEQYSNLKILKDMAYVYLGAAWILWVPFAVARRGLVFSITMTLLALFYNVAFCILKSELIRKTYRLRFITNTISFLYLYFIIYLFTIFFLKVTDVGVTFWQQIELTICFITFPLLNFLFTLRAIKKNKFDKEKTKKSVGATELFLSVGGVGISIGRILGYHLSQKQAVALIIFMVEILLLITALATPNILRLYYVYRYDVVTSVEGETISELLVCNAPKQKIGIRILKFVLKVIIVSVAIVVLYGMNQVNY